MSYRESALSCPGCGEVLDPKEVGDAIIDVCPACAGVWVDWFDGELAAMVRGAPPRSAAGGAPAKGGEGTCPRCQQVLAPERYLESRAEILRCADCAGAFVPAEVARIVAGVDAEKPAPEGAWGRLSAVLQRWFGWDEKNP